MRGKIMGFVLVCLPVGQVAGAQSCLRPIPPYVPERAEDIRAYSNLLRHDMEVYFTDMQRYLHCIDAEQMEVFAEAGRVTEGYAQVLDVVSDNSE